MCIYIYIYIYNVIICSWNVGATGHAPLTRSRTAVAPPHLPCPDEKGGVGFADASFAWLAYSETAHEACSQGLSNPLLSTPLLPCSAPPPSDIAWGAAFGFFYGPGRETSSSQGWLKVKERREVLLGIWLLGTTFWCGLSKHQAATAQMST